jgi:ribosomal protein S18 acetylase RimI-like enzyme
VKDNGDYCLIVEIADGEMAGSITSALINGVLHINDLEVKQKYRGMGLGKTMLAKLLEKADEKKLNVVIDLPAEADFFSRSLLLENFKPVMQRFIRKI